MSLDREDPLTQRAWDSGEHHSYTMDYNAQLRHGNPPQHMAGTSHGNMEKGWYSYDQHINPLAHLGIPDLLMKYQEKNTRTVQAKEYTATYPVVEPRQFAYVYDGEGYPTEQVTTYYTYLTNTVSHRTKSIYYY